ncbi:hypothetical protein GCK32_006809 [Trichostrongylus colubriformis]|uniref:Uncharacterized protein n=1 Tax=Trichostrongylus colubriformis TaxID=6319 RepID=A0AAN8IUH2_TRICO
MEARQERTQRLKIDSLYPRMTDLGDLPPWKRKEWLESKTQHDTHAGDLTPIVHDYMKKLDQYVPVFEKELAKAENRLQKEKEGQIKLIVVDVKKKSRRKRSRMVHGPPD